MNDWILKEMSVAELYEAQDEHTARLEWAEKLGLDISVYNAAVSLEKIDDELELRGL